MSEKDKITSYKEYEECLKTGELKIIKGMGKSFAYNSIGLLKTLLERDYSVALEDSIVHITSYINDIEQENKQLKEKVGELTQSLNEQMKETNKENLDCSKYAIENQQLKDKINTYENPEDLTLMFMYCDEKAKDKIKQLKEVIKEVRKSLEDYQEYIDEAKEFYSDLEDDDVVKVSNLQILNNQMVRNYDLLQILDKGVKND